LNHQSEETVDLVDARRSARCLRSALRLGRRDFNVCFVSDKEICEFNKIYRKKPYPTDVLSFPWRGNGKRTKAGGNEFENFLGDVIISARTARRNAREEGHSLREEIRWLMLHGVLHLLGYDHATDSGEMAALELALRDRLTSQANPKRRRRRKS
jgi:rRNA maturation RNase YbeY